VREFDPDDVVSTLQERHLSTTDEEIRSAYGDWFFASRYTELRSSIDRLLFRSGFAATPDRVDEILFRVYLRVARPGARVPQSLIARYRPAKDPGALRMAPRAALDRWLEIIFLKEAKLALKSERRRYSRREGREVLDNGR
jgi:hypothetical protein